MRMTLSTTLDCPPAAAWAEIKTTRLLQHVAHPVLSFEPVKPKLFPRAWKEGRYLVGLKLFGFIPAGKQWINISFPKASSPQGRQAYQVRDNGSGALAAKWDHLITLAETEDGKTRYTDQVDIQASLLTPIIWLFAQYFYRHRQRRWRRLARNGFDFEA